MRAGDLFKEKAYYTEEQKRTLRVANTMTRLIDTITKKRIEKGLSQKELAEKCGLKQSGIARLERMSVLPRLDTLLKVVDALGLSLSLTDPNQVPELSVIYIDKTRNTYSTGGNINECKLPA